MDRLEWFTSTPQGVRVDLPGHICVTLEAVAAQIPTEGSTAAVALSQEAAGDPLARWEVEDKQTRLDKLVRTAHDESAAAVLARLDVGFEGALSVEISREEARLWLRWINRHYVVLRSLEIDDLAVGEAQSLLTLMGGDIFGEDGSDGDEVAEMSFPTAVFSLCSQQIIQALAG